MQRDTVLHCGVLAANFNVDRNSVYLIKLLWEIIYIYMTYIYVYVYMHTHIRLEEYLAILSTQF